jgi:hypothetical protein
MLEQAIYEGRDSRLSIVGLDAMCGTPIDFHILAYQDVHIKRSGQKSSVYYAPESQDIPL